MSKIVELKERAKELINLGNSKEISNGRGIETAVEELEPSINIMAKALQTLSNEWSENWDIIVDTFGEELATLLDDASSESRKL